MVLRRFLVFGGQSYYPDGGAEDFLGSLDSLEDAIELGKTKAVAKARANRDPSGCWLNILDVHTGSIPIALLYRMGKGWTPYDPVTGLI